MEKFKKFCVAYDEGVEQLNYFCSQIQNIIKETQAVDSNFVLVKYTRIYDKDYYYFCHECINEYKGENCPFDKTDIDLIPKAICSRCGKEFLCNTRYDVIDNSQAVEQC
jgi:hypothetical protein